jgi:hypothetical protein
VLFATVEKTEQAVCLSTFSQGAAFYIVEGKAACK